MASARCFAALVVYSNALTANHLRTTLQIEDVYDLCWTKEATASSSSSITDTAATTIAAAARTAKRRRGAPEPSTASIDSWCLAQAEAVEQKVLAEQQELAAAHSSGRGASHSPVRQRRSGNVAAAQRSTTISSTSSSSTSSSGPDLAGCIAVLLTDTYGVRSLIVQACIDLLAALESARSSSSSSTGTEADDTYSSSSSAYAKHCALAASTFSLLLRGLRSSAAGSLLLLARAAAVQTLSAGPYNGALGSVMRQYTGLLSVRLTAQGVLVLTGHLLDSGSDSSSSNAATATAAAGAAGAVSSSEKERDGASHFVLRKLKGKGIVAAESATDADGTAAATVDLYDYLAALMDMLHETPDDIVVAAKQKGQGGHSANLITVDALQVLRICSTITRLCMVIVLFDNVCDAS
jgi:hypothetical protein